MEQAQAANDSPDRVNVPYPTRPSAGLGIGRLQNKLSETVAREKSAIESELHQGAALNELLHNVISNLEEKLAPVRQQNPPQDSKSDRAQNGVSSFYQVLFSNNATVDNAIARLQHIIRDLEV